MASKDRQHTLERIDQFRREANGDRTVFEEKILKRAAKSGADKRELTAELLEEQGDRDLAGKVRRA